MKKIATAIAHKHCTPQVEQLSLFAWLKQSC